MVPCCHSGAMTKHRVSTEDVKMLRRILFSGAFLPKLTSCDIYVWRCCWKAFRDTRYDNVDNVDRRAPLNDVSRK